jgi:hypothetical protein
MENKIPIRFFTITFLWSWLFMGVAIFIGYMNSGNFSLMDSGIGLGITVFGACGPAIGAIISIYTVEGKDALKILLNHSCL